MEVNFSTNVFEIYPRKLKKEEFRDLNSGVSCDENMTIYISLRAITICLGSGVQNSNTTGLYYDNLSCYEVVVLFLISLHVPVFLYRCSLFVHNLISR